MERDLSGDPRSAAMDESTEVKEKREEDSSMEMTEQTLAGENAFVDPGGTASKATNPSSSSVNDNSESDDEGADELQIEALESSLAENPFNYEAHVQDSQTKSSKPPPPKDEEDSGEEDDEEEDNEEHGNTLCGDCGGNYANDEFWICCDICEKWFHGKCVKITPARAEQIKQYECPACSNNKRARA